MPRSQFACVTWDTVTFKAVRCCRSWCHDSLAEWHFSAQFKELTPTAQHCYNTSNTQVSCTVIIMFSYMQSYVGKLTLATGGAFPALFADAGEGVSSSYTSSTVGTRTGGACAILGCRKREKHQSKIREMHRIVRFFLTLSNLKLFTKTLIKKRCLNPAWGPWNQFESVILWKHKAVKNIRLVKRCRSTLNLVFCIPTTLWKTAAEKWQKA